MSSDLIEAVAQAHPLQTRAHFRKIAPGASVAEIVASFDLPTRFGLPHVQLIKAGQIMPVPISLWGKIRPKPGTRVEVGFAVEGPAIAALGAAMVSAAAPYIAGTLMGLAVDTLVYTVAVAAISVVGGLLVNALIPPVKQPRQDQQQFVITGVQNAENRYGIYPKVLGRHRIFPPKTARGFTETVGRDIYYRGRMTFGWGPVALEDLRIGTTPIHEFENVELEFLNVDRAATVAKYPELAGITKAWRSGSAAMTLCPDDVFEDGYNVKLSQNENVVRVTRERTESASIDIAFPQGAVRYNNKQKRFDVVVDFDFHYRQLGSGTWISAGVEVFRAQTTSYIRFTKQITFPTPGQYEIRVRRIGQDHDEPKMKDASFLSAIRSFRSGNLPSHEGVSEVAFRLRASEQLSGNVDSLNAIVLQMAPIWTGTRWTAPQPVRHPAWVYLAALRGNHLRRPVVDTRLDLAAFKAWADEEPHWTCDYVVDAETRTADVLDVIAASGRARRALTDLQYSIIRDGAQGPVRQVFSPRNSWGFKGTIQFPRPIHALRCLVRSERLDWEQDEVTVYADGYNATNATEFETLEIPGVVVTAATEDEGNAWRLGRYHLAQAILRPETFEFNADWEHMRVTRGDKVQLVHDVPVIGVGAARVTAVDGTSLTLDEFHDFASAVFRLTVRRADGTRRQFQARSPRDPSTRRWEAQSPRVAVGDLLVIEELTQESMEVLITGIYPEGDNARLTAVPAAPGVLLADQGEIPRYQPIITPGRQAELRGPEPPVVLRIVSDESTMLVASDGTVQARIAVTLEPVLTAGELGAVQLRWRPAGGDDPWLFGGMQAIGNASYLTDTVQRGTEYLVEVRTLSGTGRSRGWVRIGTILAQGTEAPPPDVTGFVIVPVEQQVQLRWNDVPDIPDIAWAEIRYAAAEDAAWNASVLLERVAYPMTTARLFARAGTYLIKWMDWEGRYSLEAASAFISTNQIRALNAVEVLECSEGWTGRFEGTAVSPSGALVLAKTGEVYLGEGLWVSGEVVDLGAVYPVQITPYIEAGGLSAFDVMSAWNSLAALPSLASSNPDAWSVETEVRTSEDNQDWSEWQAISGGDFVGRYFAFRVRLRSLREDVTPRVDVLAFVLDMPDRVAGTENVLCPAAGLHIDYDPAFHAVPSLVATPRDAPSGARVVISGKTRSGFDIRFYNSANTAIAQRFDWVARGYGREAET